MQVTAEGIETPEELAVVRASGCMDGQGSCWDNPWRIPSSRTHRPGRRSLGDTAAPAADALVGIRACGSGSDHYWPTEFWSDGFRAPSQLHP